MVNSLLICAFNPASRTMGIWNRWMKTVLIHVNAGQEGGNLDRLEVFARRPRKHGSKKAARKARVEYEVFEWIVFFLSLGQLAQRQGPGLSLCGRKATSFLFLVRNCAF